MPTSSERLCCSDEGDLLSFIRTSCLCIVLFIKLISRISYNQCKYRNRIACRAELFTGLAFACSVAAPRGRLYSALQALSRLDLDSNSLKLGGLILYFRDWTMACDDSLWTSLILVGRLGSPAHILQQAPPCRQACRLHLPLAVFSLLLTAPLPGCNSTRLYRHGNYH